MRGIFLYTIALLLLSGCASNETDRPSADSVNPLDTLDVELPEGIRELDNLTVYPSLASPQYEIEFIEEQSIVPPENHIFSMGYDIAVGDSGMVYINENPEILVFDPGGNHVATMGGEGKGPGEHHPFGGNEMHIQGDRLFTYDVRLKRINIFSLNTFEPAGMIKMDPQNWRTTEATKDLYPGGQLLHAPLYYPFGDSLLLLRFNSSGMDDPDVRENDETMITHSVESSYFKMTRSGELISGKVLEMTHNLNSVENIVMDLPLLVSDRNLLAVGDDGHLYTANSRYFLIKRYSSEGSYQHSFFYPSESLDIDWKTFMSSFDGLQKYFRDSNLPRTVPVMDDLIVDDENRLWIPTYAGSDDYYRWYVFNQAGEHLATFNWSAKPFEMAPEHRSGIRAIKDDFLYAYEETAGNETDSEGGHYVRYRIELTPSKTGGQ